MDAITTAEAIAEMMSAWDRVMAAARQQFLDASEEELYQIAKSAMDHALNTSRR